MEKNIEGQKDPIRETSEAIRDATEKSDPIRDGENVAEDNFEVDAWEADLLKSMSPLERATYTARKKQRIKADYGEGGSNEPTILPTVLDSFELQALEADLARFLQSDLKRKPEKMFIE